MKINKEDQLYNIAEVKVQYSTKVKASERFNVTSSVTVANVLRNLYGDEIEWRESFYVLCLNRRNQVLCFYKVGTGGTSGVLVDIKQLLVVAIQTNATAIIITHNHPSGNIQPSDSDRQLTKRVKEASTLLDIQLLDHLILTEESYYSFADEGMM